MDQLRPVGRLFFPPEAGPAVAPHLDLHAGRGDLGERTDGIDRVEEGRLVSGQFGRQAQFDRAAVPQAGSDRQTFGQQPWGTVKHRGAAAGAHVEAGRIDHQRRRPVAAQELAPGQSDRFACTAALGKARLPHELKPLNGRQGLRPGEARQGTLERRCRRGVSR